MLKMCRASGVNITYHSNHIFKTWLLDTTYAVIQRVAGGNSCLCHQNRSTRLTKYTTYNTQAILEECFTCQERDLDFKSDEINQPCYRTSLESGETLQGEGTAKE